MEGAGRGGDMEANNKNKENGEQARSAVQCRLRSGKLC